MPIILKGNTLFGSGSSGNQAEVDSDNHLYITERPSAYLQTDGIQGRITMVTGALNFPFAVAQMVVFSGVSYPGPAAAMQSRQINIRRMRVGGIITSTVTTAAAIWFNLFVIRGALTGPNGSLFTNNIASSGNQNTLRSDETPSQWQFMSALSAQPVFQSQIIVGGSPPVYTVGTTTFGTATGSSGTAVGTQIFTTAGRGMQDLYAPRTPDEYPLVITPGDGFTIRIPGITGPTTGAAIFSLEVDWSEVAIY
jgi:hypothetical protein